MGTIASPAPLGSFTKRNMPPLRGRHVSFRRWPAPAVRTGAGLCAQRCVV